MTSFDISVVLSAGTEEEHSATVSGSYSAAYKARVPPGEYMPLEPDEPASFTVDSVTAVINGTTVDLLPLLSNDQVAWLAEEGLEYVAGEHAEAEYSAAEARQEARQEAADIRESYGEKW